MPNFWERLPEESEEAYHAFSTYRDMPLRRSALRAYHIISGKSDARQTPGTWNRWYTEHQWRERCSAYDQHFEQERLADEAILAEHNALEQDALLARIIKFFRTELEHAETYQKFPPVKQMTADGHTIVMPVGIKERNKNIQNVKEIVDQLNKAGAIRLPQLEVEHAGADDKKEFLPGWLLEGFREQIASQNAERAVNCSATDTPDAKSLPMDSKEASPTSATKSSLSRTEAQADYPATSGPDLNASPSPAPSATHTTSPTDTQSSQAESDENGPATAGSDTNSLQRQSENASHSKSPPKPYLTLK